MWTGWAERGAGEGAEGRRGDLATVTAERGAGLQLPPHRPALPSGKPGLALVGVDRCLQAVLGALGFRRGAKVGTPRSRYVGLAEGKSAGRTGASGSLSNRSPSICWAVHSIVQGASESERGVCAVLEAGLVPALEGGARLRLPAPDAANGGLNHGSSPPSPRGWESEPQVPPARAVLGPGRRPPSWLAGPAPPWVSHGQETARALRCLLLQGTSPMLRSSIGTYPLPNSIPLGVRTSTWKSGVTRFSPCGVCPGRWQEELRGPAPSLWPGGALLGT